MGTIIFIVTVLISGGMIAGTIFMGKGRSGSQSKVQLATAQKDVVQLNSHIETLVQKSSQHVSRPQLEGVVVELTEVNAAIESQRGLLKEIEEKLDRVQKSVETKEAEQQEVKSAKEEDEEKLQGLMAAYSDVSSESVNLEQELAVSLKNLDSIMSEVDLGDEQKEVLQDMSNTLSAAGARLRDLITDYKAVQERLEALKAQHSDLEDEYTKLVEQQLGV